MTPCVDPVSLVCGQRGSLHGCASPLPLHSLQLLRSAVARSGANLASTSCVPAPRPLYPCTGWSRRREAGGAVVEPPRSLRVRWVQWKKALDVLCPPDSLFPNPFSVGPGTRAGGTHPTPRPHNPHGSCSFLYGPGQFGHSGPVPSKPICWKTPFCAFRSHYGAGQNPVLPLPVTYPSQAIIFPADQREVTLEGLQANSNAWGVITVPNRTQQNAMGSNGALATVNCVLSMETLRW